MKRIVELDCLRGFAILMVMGVHVPARTAAEGLPVWSRSGWLGVDLFFVLSGFLISNLLFNEYSETGAIRLARFFLRRALKLYPSFYLMLLCVVVALVAQHVPIHPSQLAGEILLTQNYLGSLSGGHTWSLAVEEHFYILLPLVLLLLFKTRRRDPLGAVPWIFAGVAITCLALRLANAVNHPIYDHRTHYELSHLRFDALFFGVFLSWLHNFRSGLILRLLARPWRFPITFASVLMLSSSIIADPYGTYEYTFGFTLNYLAFGTLLLLALYKEAGHPMKSTRLSGYLASLGMYSYTIYLWHVPLAVVIGAFANRFGQVNIRLLQMTYFAASIMIGGAISRLVERPVLAMRDRIFVAFHTAPPPHLAEAAASPRGTLSA